jgi:hypothetical protein
MVKKIGEFFFQNFSKNSEVYTKRKKLPKFFYEKKQQNL